jgi:hypothetical protein
MVYLTMGTAIAFEDIIREFAAPAVAVQVVVSKANLYRREATITSPLFVIPGITRRSRTRDANKTSLERLFDVLGLQLFGITLSKTLLVPECLGARKACRNLLIDEIMPFVIEE